jgi:hypothetical protein
MQTKQIALILLIMLIGTSLISGSIPFTTSQFINQTTDGNYTTFNLNGYDGLCLVVDGNKISFDNCLNVVVDGNIIGEQGQIPFLNSDGNALSVHNGFDFNRDTNTLRADFFVGDISGATGIYRDLDGGTANSVYLPTQIVDGGNASN